MMQSRSAAVALLSCIGLLLPGSLAAANAAGAGDSGDVSGLGLQDIAKIVPGMILDLAKNRSEMLRCPSLAGGTVGTPEQASQPGRKGKGVGNPLKAGDKSDAPRSLPQQVIFRGTHQTYNRKFQFAVAKGTIWYKSNTAVTGIHEPWAKLSVPKCVGTVSQISADDDEMIVMGKDRWIYDVDGILREPKYFNWSLRWGPPFWTGPGMKMPANQTWAWSVVSPLEDGNWIDPAGNKTAIGWGKVSHIWMLSHQGQRLSFRDPWLPEDDSYAMCGPHRDRFRSANMNVSGSTIFVIGRHGDMYTRLFDFDISGLDSLFFKYSYADQRGVAKPKIQLPGAPWVRQPKIHGTITDRISIEKVGKNTVHRTLRVEGRKDGHVGYWQKDITAAGWRFHRTGGHLVGHRLDNPRQNTSARGLGPSSDRSYSAKVSGATVTIPNFNAYCTPAQVNVRLTTGEKFTLRLHTVDNIRQSTRAYGLDDDPRVYSGELEVPSALRRTADAHVKAYLDTLGSGRWISAPVDATTDTLAFRNQPWTLNHG